MLTQEQIQICQSKFNLSYHVEFAHICQQLIGFENKDVLEVGGSLPPDFVFDYLGVKSWTGIETPDYEDSLQETGGITHKGTIIKNINNISNYKFKNNHQQDKYKFFLENIEDLPEEYSNQYDLIFSIATFEHIHKLPLALDKMFLALKPGGKLFSIFSPIWSAHDGHHLPQIIDRNGNKYNFGNSPIPPWGHLLMSRGEMARHLYQKMDKQTADRIVYHVYQSNHINRFFTEDYIDAIKQSLFAVNKFELIFKATIDSAIEQKLKLMNPGRTEFANNGILLVLDKDTRKQAKKELISSVNSKTINMNNYKHEDNWQLNTTVAFLIFNRPDTTARVFEAIRQAKPPKLLVVADGARVDKPGEAEKCAATRAIIDRVDWECEVLTNYSDVNLGCRKRVSSGLDWVLEQVEEAIILEDDCLPHPSFFRYCQELLEKYRNDERIMMISGNNFQLSRNIEADIFTEKTQFSGAILQSKPEKSVQKCKICGSNSHYFATAKFLQKYDVSYFQCSHCGFVQTEEPYWLDEAYSEAIAVSDVGLVYRNNMMANIASKLLFNYFDHQAKFLDYGGGYGLFVRLMRDKGFDFYWFDKFCKNIFACGFEFQDNRRNNLELITAFELFEHLNNPVQELEEILNLCPSILFSTELLPEDNPTPDKWWYYTPHEGQHISIFTRKSLEILASKHNLKLYSDDKSLHLLTRKQDFPANLFEELANSNLQPITKKSLLSHDFDRVVNNLLLKNREADTNKLAKTPELKQPIIIIDGIFFQLSQNGIARVWKSLLEEWANTDFANHILVLDRASTAPKILGIKYRTVSAYSYNNTNADREMLQQVCDEEKADLFISTYYTTPLSTPSVFMAYDMIPEILGVDIDNLMWREKHYGINHASAYISISESTARDLLKLFPHTSSELVTVAPCGIQNIFSPANYEEIDRFKAKYDISKPYFVLVGDRVGVNGYKNTSLFFNAFSQIPNSQDFEIVCVGSQSVLEPQLRAYVPDATVHLLKLDDNELRIAYSGAIALVYPSKYEGFGLPVLEAMACGCPVITCPNGSIPEVGGEAVLYVNSDDVDELTNKLLDVRQPEVRQSLIAAGLEQAKKFSWSSMAEKVSAALLKAVDLPPKKSIDAPISINELNSWIEQYQKNLSNLSAIERLRQVRKQLADLWLELPAEEIAIAYRSETGKIHKLLLDSGIRNEQLTDREQAFVTNLLSRIDEKSENPKAIQYLLASMQYRYASELSNWFDLNTIPYWLLQDYLGFMLFSPAYFQETGEANSYYCYLEEAIDFIHGNTFSNSDLQLWQNIATYFAEKANFIPLYFNDGNLKNIYQKRAEIIEFYLKNRKSPVEHEFTERSPQRKKIRLGILAYHFGVQTETFATLPIYKHLNRDLFEVILFPIITSNHRLERYCAGHSDELIVLPSNLQEQVQTIRDADLDILFISTNVTAVTNQITLLTSHRLARIQIVDANSPVSTGMRHVDYYISSKLSEPKENAQSHHTEKLITLDVPPQCFDFATEEQIVATTSLSRDSLGIDPNAVVYISGANFYKILPEVELTWTKIIDRVPNSVLILYPFNPNWSSSYPVTAFRKRIADTFAKYGLPEERLIILDPAPNRADVQERLKLADIYLDSYPYSGMTSLIDPLQVGLPSIVLEGKTSRSQKGASLLRSLQITNLITDSEETYIQLAVKLGTNPELRKQQSDRIKQKMQQNPSFLDSRSYSAQMGALFQQLFQQYRAKNLIDRLGLRDINLVMFPDWHQSEESLYEDFANVLKTMSSNRDRSRMTLLIDTDGIDGEDANLLFSSVVMNLLMEEAVDIADELEVSLLDDLTENEWELLLSLLQGKISLNNENQTAIAKAKAQSLKVYS